MAAEDLQRPAISAPVAARIMLGFAWRSDRRLACEVLAVRIIGAVLTALFALWIGYLTDAVAHRDGRAAAWSGGLIVLSIASGALLNYAAARMTRALSDKTHHEVQRRLLRLVGGSPTLEITETPAHLTQLERLQEASWEFGDVIPALINAAQLAIQLVVTLVLLATVDPWLLLLVLFGLPVVVFGPKASFVWYTAQQLASEPARRMSVYWNLGTDAASAKEIRLFRLRPTILAGYTAAADESLTIQLRHIVQGQLIGVGSRLFFCLGYLGALVLVVHRVLTGAAPLGSLVTTAVLGGQLLSVVAASSTLAVWTSQVMIAASRFVYLDRLGTSLRDSSRMTGSVPDRLQQGIRLHDVSFRYPGRQQDTLDGVDLLLPAGATVALVGDNGAGKSTLIKLLSGLYPPTAGTISIDGTDLATVDPDRWRERLSAGFQDHARFEFIAQETVGIGDLDRVDEPAAAIGALGRAAAEDLLVALPSGLATQLGPAWDGGIDLSGGQWQKLAIARAMMRRRPLLLLLDEPTAAIDAESEHRLFTGWTEAARELRAAAGAITVLVSHRFSTVRMADLIVVLQDGRITEAGTHAELMDAGGRYATLFNLQARAYGPDD